jgi:hypothetical protein
VVVDGTGLLGPTSLTISDASCQSEGARRECEQPALFLCRGRVLLHILFGAPGHFIGRNIFDVRRDVPLVAEWIDDRAGAVAVELILDRTRLFRARRNRLLEDGVHIVDVERDREGGATESLRAFDYDDGSNGRVK